MRTLMLQLPYCVHTQTRIVCKYPSARYSGSSVTRCLCFRPTRLLEITMSLDVPLTLGRRCKAKAKQPRRHCTLSAVRAYEQASADRVRDAAQDPSPWCDMDDIDHQVFNVDKCGNASITDSSIVGCSLQDLMLADIALLQASMDILPEKPRYYRLRAALYSLMADIHETVMDGSISLESFVDMRSSVVTLRGPCTLASFP